MKELRPSTIAGMFYLADFEAGEIRPARFFTPDQAKARHDAFHSLIADAAPVASARDGEACPLPRPALGGW